MLNQAFINLKTLRSNAEKIKRLLPKTTKFCAVVKADAYGHGLEVCAQALYSIVDSFAVALTEEGVKLRLSGIDKDVLVLTPVFNFDTELAIRYDLTLSVESLKEIKTILCEAKKQGKTAKVHIKYNSGMNRQGLDSLSELKEILEFAKGKKNIVIDGFFSHYAKPQEDKSLKRATDNFLLANELVKSYNNNAVSHISASGGFLRGKFFDMVRIGILLYGYYPFKTDKIKVKPIMKLYSYVLKNRTLKRGSSALYGNKKVVTKTQVAFIRYGYADGLPRKQITGQFNNRCMDLTAVKTDRQLKGKVLVLGDADKFAKAYKSINYEVLVNCSHRAEKIYRR